MGLIHLVGEGCHDSSVRSFPLLSLRRLWRGSCRTAAVGARTQIDAVRQAEEIKANVQNQLDAAAQSEKQKLERAESAARP